MIESGPIGVFDSGFGGLTILKSFEKGLPEYDFLYLGDNARAPYGSRSYESVYEFTLEGVNYLFEQGCPLVILACNTASAKALRSIQQNDLDKIAPHNRVLGVIRPTTEVIGTLTKSREIGIFATQGTVESESYLIEIGKFFPDVKVYQEACPMWVPLIENGELDNEGASYFVKKHINQLLSKGRNIDTILLGCTHYPLLIKTIERSIPKNIKVISQDQIVTPRLIDYLARHPELETRCRKNSKINFLTTDSASGFNGKASLFFGRALNSSHIHL